MAHLLWNEVMDTIAEEDEEEVTEHVVSQEIEMMMWKIADFNRKYLRHLTREQKLILHTIKYQLDKSTTEADQKKHFTEWEKYTDLLLTANPGLKRKELEAENRLLQKRLKLLEEQRRLDRVVLDLLKISNSS